MADGLQPLPYDPSRVNIQGMIDLHAGEPWLLTKEGNYDSFVVETFKKDGSNPQTLIALQWPTRINGGTHEEVLVQLLIHPEDVRGVIDVLSRTCDWLDEVKRMSG